MPKCTICISPFREKIDIALTVGTSLRDVAKQFNVGVSSLHRHKKDGHICDLIKAAAAEKQIQSGLNIQKCAQEIYDICLRGAAKAENEDIRAIGSCLGPAVKVLEILNKDNEDKPPEQPKDSGYIKSYMGRAKEVYETTQGSSS